MKFPMVFLSVLASQGLQAQESKDTIPIYDHLQKGPVSRIAINPISVSKNKESGSLIIIDNKIYQFGSVEIGKFKQSRLIHVSTILDTTSVSGITKILIYKTH